MSEVSMLDVDNSVPGAGPVRPLGGFDASFRGPSVTVIDALDEIGSQRTELHPEQRDTTSPSDFCEVAIAVIRHTTSLDAGSQVRSGHNTSHGN